MAHIRAYSNGVLVGNWWEERIIQESELGYTHDEGKKLNLITKTLGEFRTYNPAKCSVCPMDGYLRVGSFNEIVNPGPSPYYEKSGLVPPRSPHVLSLGILNENYLGSIISRNVENILAKMRDSDFIKTVASTSLKPAARNIFRLESGENYPEGTPVCYGQPIMFALEPAIEAIRDRESTNTRLYLASDLRRIGDHTSQTDTQSVYFELNQPSFSAQWRLEAADPNFRQELEGRPVKLDEKLLIRHIRTNQALALEPKTLVRNAFGLDMGVSAKTYYDSHKVERDVNTWLFTSVMHSEAPQPVDSSPELTAENTSFECDVARQRTNC